MSHIAPWFAEAKFGVFIHWLLNNIEMNWGHPAESRTPSDYRQWAREFQAEQFDARQWARQFKNWGARYAVLTTKHHIGFALFDGPGSPFTAVNSSPARRDLVHEFVEGMRAEGLKVGLYYSLPDWSHPDYASCAGGTDRKKYSERDEPEQWARFVRHMFAEVEHLCTAYGRIDLLWFDGDWERSAEQWKTLELAEMIQRLQPHIVINNRLRHRCLGHYGTPESTYPVYPRGGDFNEFCTTLGDNWDGLAANQNITPPHELVRLLGDTAGMGWNLLLNVAPRFDGTIPEVQTLAMSELGTWIQSHREAIHGSEAGLPPGLFNGASTHRGGVLYLIAYDAPRDELVVKGLRSTVRRITHLATGETLDWRYHGGRKKFGQQGWLFIRLPPERVERHATVVRVEFEDDTCQIETPGGSVTTWRGRPVLDEKTTYQERA
jgi:alpha-L-fucosidase